MKTEDIIALIFYTQKFFPFILLSFAVLISLVACVHLLLVAFTVSSARRAGYNSIMNQLPQVIEEGKELKNVPAPKKYGVRLAIEFKTGQLRALSILEGANRSKLRNNTRPGSGKIK